MGKMRNPFCNFLWYRDYGEFDFFTSIMASNQCTEVLFLINVIQTEFQGLKNIEKMNYKNNNLSLVPKFSLRNTDRNTCRRKRGGYFKH